MTEYPLRIAPSKQSTGKSHFNAAMLINRNIGFMKYWTLDSIPNFLLASPVLGISILGLYRYTCSRTNISPIVMPLVIQHGIMTFLLIFQSHTQIALRVVSTDPVFWWLLTEIAFRDGEGLTRIGRGWIWWTVIWGAISIALWAGHYPPA
jgi:phosphatidylinositol glycan class V